MRCLMCAAEMDVTHVVQDGTMQVPGFEHHTLECLECGDIERRLVFTREKTQPISPSLRLKKQRIVKPRTPMEAFERVRRRDEALAAQRAADRTATAAVARIKEIATEFARRWDNLIPHRQSSPSEPSALDPPIASSSRSPSRVFTSDLSADLGPVGA